MILKLLLGLRDNRHMVDVVKVNGETRPVLGVSHPQEGDKRANIVRQWGMSAESPRREPPATIDQPLPQRSQAILSYQVGPQVRQRINGGLDALPDSRQRSGTGTKERVRRMYPDE